MAFSRNAVWDPARGPNGGWVSAQDMGSGGGGGGGGAATIADGADVSQGARADAPATGDGSGSFSLIALIKLAVQWLISIGASSGNTATATGSMSAAAATSSGANVTSVTTSTTLLAANTARKQAVIANDSTAVLYVLFGSGTASTTNYTTQLAAGATLFIGRGEYTGQINGIWAAVNGAARVTQVT